MVVAMHNDYVRNSHLSSYYSFILISGSYITQLMSNSRGVYMNWMPTLLL